MNTALGLAFLVGGIALMAVGFNAAQSVSSDVSRVFTGTPSDRSMWMLVGGFIAAIIGLISLLRGRSRH